VVYLKYPFGCLALLKFIMFMSNMNGLYVAPILLLKQTTDCLACLPFCNILLAVITFKTCMLFIRIRYISQTYTCLHNVMFYPPCPVWV